MNAHLYYILGTESQVNMMPKQIVTFELNCPTVSGMWPSLQCPVNMELNLWKSKRNKTKTQTKRFVVVCGVIAGKYIIYSFLISCIFCAVTIFFFQFLKLKKGSGGQKQCFMSGPGGWMFWLLMKTSLRTTREQITKQLELLCRNKRS